MLTLAWPAVRFCTTKGGEMPRSRDRLGIFNLIVFLLVLFRVTTITAQVTLGEPVVGNGSATVSSTASIYADVMGGADAFAQVQSAISAFGSGGGQVLATGFTSGPYTVSSTLNVSNSGIRILWGATTFLMGTNQIKITGSDDEMDCIKGVTCPHLSFT
jgi:hypothetical protein